MIKFAIYGKGGIGKSTTTANLTKILAQRGRNVLQIGCDPKADSTLLLHKDVRLTPVLQKLRENPCPAVQDVVYQADDHIFCCEAGGPIPGLGCAGRGIGMVLEYLEKQNAYQELSIDVAFYDVLGDVVCGGFSMPMRKGFADHVLLLTSGETMSLYACENIATAIQNFASRGYADLGGIILNAKNVKDEEEDVLKLADKLHTVILGKIPFLTEIRAAEKKGVTLIDCYPDTQLRKPYEDLVDTLQKTFIDTYSH